MRALRMALAVLGMVALTLPAQAQKDKKRKIDPAPVDAETALKPGQIVGQVVTVTETMLQLRVEYQHLELKDAKGGKGGRGDGGNKQLTQALRQQQQIAQAQQKLRMAKNQQQAYQALQQLQRLVQQAQLNAAKGGGGKDSPYKIVTDSKDFNVELSGKVEFRVSNPTFLTGLQFDDMGNVKKFTPDDLKELKGKGNLPGYKAVSTDVKRGAKVQVTLAKDKEAENKLRGTIVLVTEQGTEPAATGKRKKK